MQRLNRGMLSRYEIEDRRPDCLRLVQFGLDETLLGVADRLLDEAGVGVACVPTAPGAADGLAAQDGLYTLVIRGYEGQNPVKREQVVQCLTRLVDPGESFRELDALAAEPELSLGLVNTDAPDGRIALGLLARLLTARRRADLGGLSVICLGDAPDCGARARDFIKAVAAPWGLAGFGDWLEERCAFLSALAEGFALRAEADEAAKLCRDMNYADACLHLAEPFARLVAQASPGLPLPGGIEAVEDLAPAFGRRHRLLDPALCLLAAPGWLLGCDTLRDCMGHEALRAFAGRAVYEELLPGDPALRGGDAPYVIECFERFENPLTRNALLRVGKPLMRRVRRGLLPRIRAWAAENFEPPRRLSFALAAAIMLYAGVRRSADGAWEVARGGQTQELEDDPEVLEGFSTLAHDMPPESLAYAALADRSLWEGEDLRGIDGLEQRVALDIAAMQRDPSFLPE